MSTDADPAADTAVLATGAWGPRNSATRVRLFWIVVGVVGPLLLVYSLSVGRNAIPFGTVLAVLFDNVLVFEFTYTQTEESVVELVRLPRIIAAILAGAGLAIAGAALHGVSRNPLVGPQIIGVSSGAGFGGALIMGLRFRIDVLSFGDEDAQAPGLHVERTRWLVLMAVAMISAAVVAVAGVVGWIGLVGPGHGALLPASAALGAIYLMIIDNIARSATAAEIPLGILTALIGAPVFAVLLRRTHMSGWRRD